MSSTKPEQSNESPAKEAIAAADKARARAEQSDRLAAALRDNLKRRKAQARARREPGSRTQEG